jgi:hypothetical protein
MTKLVFSMSEGQADRFPDWQTRHLTVDTGGSVHLVYRYLQDADSNVLAHFDGGLWTAAVDGCEYSDVGIVADEPNLTSVTPSDLAHGFVVGDWHYNPTGNLTIDPYPARLGQPWNGFANPYFEQAVADRVIADQQSLLDSLEPEKRLGLYSFGWDGQTILVTLIPRPGTASAEDMDGPDRIEPIDIDGIPHWNLGLGWSWEQVNQHGDPVRNEVTTAQRHALFASIVALNDAWETMRLEPSRRRRLADGSDVIPLVGRLGRRDGHQNTPVSIYTQIGTVTIAPDGAILLKLDQERRLDLASSAQHSN